MLSTSVAVLWLAAATVAVFHAILPDHWMPIALVARAERWPLTRSSKVALWTAIGHVAGSLALGVVILALGYSLNRVVHLEGPIVGVVLIATGVGLYVWKALRRGGQGAAHTHPHPHIPGDGVARDHDHGHTHDHSPDVHDHSHPHAHPPAGASRTTPGAWLIPAGIAASPDPTVIPVMLAAAALGAGVTIQVLLVYALVTVISIVGLTLAAVWGGYRAEWHWLEHHADQVTALVLIGLGIAAWLAL